MTYEESVRYLMSLGKELAAPRQPAPRDTPSLTAQKFDLRNISVLADRLGNPHLAVPCVHVAGTNGKGSTCAMLTSILQKSGLNVGLYTSPHLERINERICVNGAEISDNDFATAFTRVQAFIEVLLASGSLAAHPTYFECLTAMAFNHFASGCQSESRPRPDEESALALQPHASQKRSVDFAVYEVGMGGRLDSTNIVQPEVAVITQVDFDHENFLGHSIEEIAAEKAGIIKPNAWVVSSAERPEARAVIQRVCAERNARLIEIDDVFKVESAGALLVADPELVEWAAPNRVGCCRAVVANKSDGRRIEFAIGLPGRFQIRNALAALATARLLAERGFPITDEAIIRGIEDVRWPGRLECLRVSDDSGPNVFLDGAHNPAAARALLEFWQEHFAGRRIHLVYGALRDKAVDEIAGLLFPHAASVTLTQARTSRAISADVLATMTHGLAPHIEVVPDAAEALMHAVWNAAPGDAVFATGSLYLCGELRAAWPRISAQSLAHVDTPLPRAVS
jgi:dihydrofolate synthase/folylpolyglutamate synthase